jgi:hypothetical protein
MNALNGVHAFTADGILAPRDVAGRQPIAQFLVVTIEGGQWKRVFPDSGFAS